MKNRSFILLTALLICALFASCGALSNDSKASLGEKRTAKYGFEMDTELVLEPSSSGEVFYASMDVTTTCISGRDYYQSPNSFEAARGYVILPDGTELSATSIITPCQTQVDVKKGDVFKSALNLSLPAKYVPGTYDVRVECNGSEELFEDVHFGVAYKDGVEYATTTENIVSDRVSFAQANRYAQGLILLYDDFRVFAVADSVTKLSSVEGGYGQESINIEKYDEAYFKNNYLLFVYKKSINTAFYYEASLLEADESSVSIKINMKHFPATVDGGYTHSSLRVMMIEVPVQYTGQVIELNYSSPVIYQGGEKIDIRTAKYDFEADTELWCEPEYGGKTCYTSLSVNTVCISGRDCYSNSDYSTDINVCFIMPDGTEVKAEVWRSLSEKDIDLRKGDSFKTELNVYLPAECIPGTCDVRVEYSGSVKIFEDVVLHEQAAEYDTVPYEIQAEQGTFERADEIWRGFADIEYPITALIVTQPSEQLSCIDGGNSYSNINIEKYTAEFFENNFVIIVYTRSGSTGYAFETQLVSADESLVTVETIMVDFPRRNSIVVWIEERHVMLVEVPVKYAGQTIECRYSVPLSLRSEYE
ncbi:MAG: hypothetical protein IJY27_06400 [Clostridia bacterium]|nr:hypothetical protein [Clostridia bacterium]